MTGIATDIGNILGQSCRLDSRAELWRLKVHVPILIGFITGGMLGEVAFIYWKHYALLVPCFFSGAIGCIYLCLPYVQKAADVLAKKSEMKSSNAPQSPQFDVRIVGDPTARNRKSSINVYANIEGKNVDLEIKNFYSEMEEMDEEMSFVGDGAVSMAKSESSSRTWSPIIQKTANTSNEEILFAADDK